MRRGFYLPAAAVLYIAGNLAAEYIPWTGKADGTAHAAILVCIAAYLAASVLAYMRLRMPWILLFSFSVMGAGGNICSHFFSICDAEKVQYGNGYAKITGTVTGNGLSSSGKPLLRIRLHEANACTIIYNVAAGVECLPGDTVTAYVRCTEVRNFSDDFDYAGYMAGQGITFLCFMTNDTAITVRPDTMPPVKFIPARLRTLFSRKIDTVLEGDRFRETRAVVKALAYGYQDEISQATEESFRNSGAVHLLALSGMHLGMLYWALHRILSVLGNSPAAKRIRSSAIMALLWAYTVFTGCGISILRAAVMLSIYEAGALAGRKKNGVCALAASAIIIAAADPSAPSGLSFQLSYSAMAAIFFIFPSVSSIAGCRNRLLRTVTDICAMSIACQITTAPIIFLHFKTFAFYSLIANLLCSPVVSFAMVLIPAVLLTSFTGGPVHEFTSCLLYRTIKIFIQINGTISNL